MFFKAHLSLFNYSYPVSIYSQGRIQTGFHGSFEGPLMIAFGPGPGLKKKN